jgi:PhnB protein
MHNTPREGFHSITPRIVVGDAQPQVEFLHTVFAAAGEHQTDRPSEMRIGDSLVMVTPAGAREPFPAFLHVYVDDADVAYRCALAAGAVSLEEPLTHPTAIGERWCATRSGTSVRSPTLLPPGRAREKRGLAALFMPRC